MNIGVVILHYKTYQDTIKCATSFIENLENINYKIVVVDNYSNDGSFEILQNHFQGNNNVYTISTKYNMGFAKGNNYGNSFLKKLDVNFDFVIFCNNDTYIDDSDFFNKTIMSHNQYNWDVMGPDIIRVADKVHQNPLSIPNWNNFSINKKILEFSMKILTLKVAPIILKYKKNKNSIHVKTSFEKQIQEDVCLHGAVLIFSKSYLQTFENVFYDKTFLYLEEDILYLRCKLNNLKMVYDSRIKIYHNHSSATKKIYRDEAKRKIFFLKNQIASLKVLRSYLKDPKEY